MLTEGELDGYDVWARGMGGDHSNMRGVFALRLPMLRLRPGQSYSLAWRLFSHKGNEQFRQRLIDEKGFVESDCYVLQRGQETTIRLVRSSGTLEQTFRAQSTGEQYVSFADAGVNAKAQMLVIDDIPALIDARARFIVQHQQMNDPHDPRYGAYMVYDCEGDSIYLNDRPSCSFFDRDEGAERLGMGVFLAKHYLHQKRRHRDPQLLASLQRYAQFVRTLQTPDYVTYSVVNHQGRNRGYNYPWMAEFYFMMYRVTGDSQYAKHGYETLRAVFRQFGYSVHLVEVPALMALECLRKAGLESCGDSLLQDFRLLADEYVFKGQNLTKSEVNYEQNIIGHTVQFLAQMYLITRDERYLAQLRKQLPILETFGSMQPSFYQHDIGIRHWDSFWFGKYEMYGDNYPQYWSAITASAFRLYALCTGDKSYQHRAENIVKSNLCLFQPDGKASCAFIYPEHVNGVPAHFFDPYANDQDWALSYYYEVMEGL